VPRLKTEEALGRLGSPELGAEELGRLLGHHFLEAASDGVVMEAMVALGASRAEGALELLEKHWKRCRNDEVRRACLMAIGLTRQERALVAAG